MIVNRIFFLIAKDTSFLSRGELLVLVDGRFVGECERLKLVQSTEFVVVKVIKLILLESLQSHCFTVRS